MEGELITELSQVSLIAKVPGQREGFPTVTIWLPALVIGAANTMLLCVYLSHHGRYGGRTIGTLLGLVTVIVVSGSLGYSSLAVRRVLNSQRDAARRNHTFQLLTVWRSSQMVENRSEGWIWLEKLRNETPHGTVFLGEYRLDDKEGAGRFFYHVSYVLQFIGDVSRLIQTEVADEQLAVNLFGEEFRNCMEHLQWSDRRRSDTENEEQTRKSLIRLQDMLIPACDIFWPGMTMNELGIMVAKKA